MFVTVAILIITFEEDVLPYKLENVRNKFLHIIFQYENLMI